MKRQLAWVVSIGIWMVGCGGSGGASEGTGGAGGAGGVGGAPGAPPADLTKPVVTALPSGTGTGSVLSASYGLVLRTVDCAGSCGPVPGPFETQLSYCDVGETDQESWDMTQAEGTLTTDIDMDVDIHLTGGVDSDGTFDIGGWGTEMAGQVEGTARAKGTLFVDEVTGEGHIDGSLRVYSSGIDTGVAIACLASYEIEPSE